MKEPFSFSQSKSVLDMFSCLFILLIIVAIIHKQGNGFSTQKDAVVRDPVRTTTATTTTTTTVTTTTAVTPPVDSIPLPNDYYFENNYLQKKATVINDLLKKSGDTGEAFVFIPDPHTEANRNAGQTPNLLHYLCDQTDLSRVIVGGDVFAGASADYVEKMTAAFTDGTVHYVMGNHEYDHGTTDEQLVDVYHVNKPQEIGNINRHYYYVDSPDAKLRYVVLNGWMEGSTTADDLSAQNEWLKNEALCVEKGWGILVFAHDFVIREWRGDIDLRYFSSAMKPIAKTLLEYDGKGEILGVFHGHMHQDLITRMRLDAKGNPVLDDNGDSFPLIQTTTDRFFADKVNAPYEQLIDREKDTITEQAFDVVIVDRENGKIHCVRIGAPARDNSGWLDQEQVEVRTVNMRG